MIRFAESDDFRDQLAVIVPEAVRLHQFLEFAVRHILERDYEHHLYLPTDGLLFTEPGVLGIASSAVWFSAEPQPNGDVLVTLEGVRTAPIPRPEQDEP